MALQALSAIWIEWVVRELTHLHPGVVGVRQGAVELQGDIYHVSVVIRRDVDAKTMPGHGGLLLRPQLLLAALMGWHCDDRPWLRAVGVIGLQYLGGQPDEGCNSCVIGPVPVSLQSEKRAAVEADPDMSGDLSTCAVTRMLSAVVREGLRRTIESNSRLPHICSAELVE